MFPKYILGGSFILFVLHVQAQENATKILELLDDVINKLENDMSNSLLIEDQIRNVTNITEEILNAISSADLQNMKLSDIVVFVDFQNMYNRLFPIIATRQKRYGKSKGHGHTHGHHHVCPPPIIPPPPQPDTRILSRITDLDQAIRTLRNVIDDACSRIIDAISRQRMIIMGMTPDMVG